MISELDGSIWPCLPKTFMAARDSVGSLKLWCAFEAQVCGMKCIYIFIYVCVKCEKHFLHHSCRHILWCPRRWIEDLSSRVTKQDKDALQYKSDDNIQMVNKYIDGDGVTRVYCP